MIGWIGFRVDSAKPSSALQAAYHRPTDMVATYLAQLAGVTQPLYYKCHATSPSIKPTITLRLILVKLPQQQSFIEIITAAQF